MVRLLVVVASSLLALFASASRLHGQTASLVAVSAATFDRDGPLTPSMIVTAFTSAIPANTTAEAAGWALSIRDSAGATASATPFSIAPGQVSFVMPANVTVGAATIRLLRQNAMVAEGAARIGRAAPGLFTANANGQGPPTGLVVSATREENLLFETAEGSSRYLPRPFSPAGAYLVLYGTGIRNATGLRATIADTQVPIAAASAHSQFAGLDQINLGPLPAEFSDRRGIVKLAIASGEGSETATRLVDVAPTPPATNAWSRRAELIEANSEMGVAALRGRIYVLGGYPSSRVTVSTVQAYDPAADTWRLAAPLPIAVNHSMPAAHDNGKLYLIGGQTDTNVAYTNAVQEYDPATNTWRRVANMPTARSSGAAVVIGGKIYVAGGRPPRGSDFAVYDPAKDEWQTLADLPTQRNHLAAVAFEGRMYDFGGRFEGGFQSPQSDAVEVYDPVLNRWSTGAALPKPRGGLNAVEAYGCIHVFGGEFASGVHADHDVYDPVANRWQRIGDMPVPVHGVTGAAFQDGLIYLPGGGTSQGGSSGSRIHQVYRPGQMCR